MSGQGGNIELCGLPDILSSASDSERSLHREFLHRHIGFLIDILTGEQWVKQWYHPTGCPSATPEAVARRRNRNEKYSCRYQTLTTVSQATHSDTACACGDPLATSEDPLDAVAAVAIARDGRSVGERYFDREERELIAGLRDTAGSWDEIATLDCSELRDTLASITDRPGIGDWRVERLDALLSAVADCSKTDGVTLCGLPSMRYNHLNNLLAGFPGVSSSDAWWLLLVAFDKPVWPADPEIDGLLCSLGLLEPDEYDTGPAHNRRSQLEDRLTDRQIPEFHRALAGHAVKGGVDACGDSCAIRKFLLTHRLRQQSRDESGPTIIDLFAGAGGISLGFARAEYTIDWAIDNDEDAADTYRLNHPEIPHENVVCGDIREAVQEGDLDSLGQTPDVIVGGPPCQSLSQAGYRTRLASDDDYSILDDDRTSLYNQYVRAVEKLRPRAFVMENVEGMINEVKDTGIKVGDLVVESLESIGGADTGYCCDYRLLDCSEFSIPQERKRVIIIGLRQDLVDDRDTIAALFDRLSEIRPADEYDLQQALSGIPKIKRGEGGTVVAGNQRGARSNYVKQHELGTTTSLCFNHRAREHPMEKDQRLFDEALEPGETGWDVKYKKDGQYADLIDYDVGTEENPRFKDKYRMLEWDEPAPTIVSHLAKDANSFVLPDYYEYARGDSSRADNERNRGITPREAARTQSFPDSYIFLGSFTSWYRQIGNAIPPMLGERIALVLKEYLADTTAVRPAGSHLSHEPVSTDD